MKLQPVTILNKPFSMRDIVKDSQKLKAYHQLVTQFGVAPAKAKVLLYGAEKT